ncbi:MAG: VOC family protein [Proteobacteria bacterium]|nr:VOC family protein [Pseudomonadota bacterium]
MQKISPFLWYDSEAEEAARHYVAAFPDARITTIERYPKGAPAPEGSVMTVAFELAGQSFTALNGGPMFKPTEAVSFAVSCDDQAEVDRLWEHLSQGGSTSMCGWLKDRWGFSWQIVPRRFVEIIATGDGAAKGRVFAAMMQMTKFDLAKIEAAYKG